MLNNKVSRRIGYKLFHEPWADYMTAASVQNVSTEKEKELDSLGLAIYFYSSQGHVPDSPKKRKEWL